MSTDHSPNPSTSTTPLNHAKHTQYFLRCLRTHLPTHYQSSESQRVSFAFFALSALDLLGVLHSKTTASEREEWATWLYGLQHSGGGWKGFTGASVGNNAAEREVELGDKAAGETIENVWDPADLGATFLALAALMILGDSMERVRRTECLHWLRGLQRREGCFGEMKGKGGTIEGGGDVRFCYLAAGVRWMLRRGKEMEKFVQDIDVESLADFVRRSATYEGGIAEVPGREAHAGETFCGIAALQLLGRLPYPTRNVERNHIQTELADGEFVEHVIRWLVQRQTSQLQDEDNEEEEQEDEYDAEETNGHSQTSNSLASTPGFHIDGSHAVTSAPSSQLASPPHAVTPIEPSPEQRRWAGFNGRCNKPADTCYAWWVGGSLAMLHRQHLQDFNAVERYLLEKTQHRIGGFGKMPGDPPDILHSYLGLAALAAMKHPQLKSIDARLCLSVSAREHFELGTELGRGEKSAEGEVE